MQHITEVPIDISAELNKAKNPDSGAVVLFSGDVRRLNKGKDVSHLYYEAFIPLAEKEIAKVLASAKAIWKLDYAQCIHRIGRLGITDCAVVVLTASPHRDEAYAANKYIIDQVKHFAPVWKKEVYSDGSYEWGNNCNCGTPHEHLEKAMLA